MSRLGHSMIRFVVCAPERMNKLTGKVISATKFGPKCLADLDYHFVASFRAKVAEESLDYWGGVNGKYPSNLFIMSLKNAMKEYNKIERRDLYSYPLKLSKVEKDRLVDHTLETFWEYSGSYKFFTNNCASEAYNLIRNVRADLSLHLGSSDTPKGALKRLFYNDLIDEKFYNIKEHRYHYFQSKTAILKLMFEAIESLNLSEEIDLGSLFSVNSMEKYLKLGATERKELFFAVIFLLEEKKLSKKIIVLRAFQFFEEHILTVLNYELLSKYSAYLFSLKKDGSEAVKLKVKQFDLSPHSYLKETYGIPQVQELNLFEEKRKKYSIIEGSKFFKKIFSKKFKNEINEMTKTIKNYEYFLSIKKQQQGE